MKIAYLSSFYPFRGGIAQFNASLYRALEKHGHEVKAYTFTTQYPEILFPGKTQFVTEDDDSDKIPSERVLSTINPLIYFSAARQIAQFEPDLLIMKFWMPFFAPSLGYVAGYLKKRGCSVVTVLDNVIPHEKRPGDTAFTKYFLNRNDAFVTMSSTVKNDLISLKEDANYLEHPHPVYDHFGEPVEKVKAREKLGVPKDAKVLLFFGLIRKYKGLDLLIQAMKGLPDGYFLLVAGEVYGEEQEYSDLVKELQLEDRVQLNLRYIDNPEVPLFFSAADVNVLPYRSATQSGILAIAMHFNLPVIVTDVGSLAELVQLKNTGMVIEKADENLLAESIKEFFEKDRKQDIVANIKEFKEQYDWDNLAAEIVKLADKQ